MKEEIAPLLRELASELSTTTEYLWEVMVRQASIYAISSILFAAFAFIVLILGTLIVYIKSKKAGGLIEYLDPDESPIPLMLTIALTAGWFLMILGSIVALFDIVTAILNPEYWALNQILRKFY